MKKIINKQFKHIDLQQFNQKKSDLIIVIDIMQTIL
ncbi:Uncharacterised protein [Chryseobacterium gleum]|uniref:Uncharacterized protein n=1 Tax=Chryseobacterium gleum TaxID=250 RepID=A0A448B3R0_CHRGE|nr:Uncharacterised protein [Chryseobacterium gleum]